MVRVKRKILFFAGGKETSNGLVVFNIDNYKFEEVRLAGHVRQRAWAIFRNLAKKIKEKLTSFVLCVSLASREGSGPDLRTNV